MTERKFIRDDFPNVYERCSLTLNNPFSPVCRETDCPFCSAAAGEPCSTKSLWFIAPFKPVHQLRIHHWCRQRGFTDLPSFGAYYPEDLGREN